MQRNVIIILALLVVVAAGIYVLTLPPPLEESAVKDFSGPITEKMLLGWNAANYTQFSRDFDQTMKSSMNEQAFSQTRSIVKAKVGDYVQKSFVRAERQGAYISVIYNAIFTDEPANVTVRVVFNQIGGINYVTGLWFDSPKLRA